jgi:transcriptional regulator with XRE-family HTH domain
MNVGDNIKYLRKSVLKMTRDEFGERIGISAGVLNNIERNRLAKPEQKEPLYRLICKTFGVSYQWLMTGEGGWEEGGGSLADRLAAEHGLSETGRKVLECYLRLDEGRRLVMDRFLEELAADLAAGQPSAPAGDGESGRDAFLRMAAEQYDKEKNTASPPSSAKRSDAV